MSVLLPRITNKKLHHGSSKHQLFIHEFFKKKKSSFQAVRTVQDSSLKEFKQYFLKNNLKYKVCAAERIIKRCVHLKSKNNLKFINYIDSLINEDFMEIICEVMATLDNKLLGLLFTLLNYMKQSSKFFEFHRLSPVADSLIRTINILFKQFKNHSITMEGVKLLTAILNRKNQKYFAQQIYKREDLLNLIKKLFSEKFGKMDAKCYPDVLLYSILSGGDFQKIDDYGVIIDLVEYSLKSLSRKILNDKFNSNEKLMFVGLSLDIFELYLRKIVRNIGNDPSINEFITHQMKFLSGFIFQNEEHGLMSRFCQSLMTVYTTLQSKYLNDLVDDLTKRRILKFLVQENEFFAYKNKTNAQKLITKLLIKQMLILCDIKFVSNAKWERMFNYGFEKLPTDVNSWQLQIKRKDHLEKVQATVFAFSYFYYTSLPSCYESNFKNLDQLMSIMPSKISYFSHRIDLVYVKMILYLFAVSVLINYADNLELIKSHTKYLNKLKWIGQSSESCEQIYTEHQDFIKWTISESASNLPLQIKYDFISRWIENNKTSNIILQLSAEKDKNVASLLLMLLISCQENIIFPLYSILQNVLQNQKLLKKNKHHLQNLVWSNFTHVLTLYKNNESIAFNLIAYIYLAKEGPPKVTKFNLCNIISLIITSLSSYCLNDKIELHIAFLEFIIYILIQLRKQNETVEANMFLSNKQFLQFLKSGLYSDNQKIFVMSMNIISLFNMIIINSSTYSDISIEMVAEDLNSLMQKDVHKAVCVTKLFIMSAPAKGLKPFFNITMLSQKAIREIYFNLLNIGFTMPTQNKNCWKCLNYILNKYNDKFHLAILPWTSFLIIYVITNTDLTLNDIYWLSFLKTWLIVIQPCAGLWHGKGLFSNNIITTAIEKISVEVIAAASFMKNNEFIEMSKLILIMKTCLPSEIKMTLKEISSISL